jgi:hypothetical protein
MLLRVQGGTEWYSAIDVVYRGVMCCVRSRALSLC